MSKKQKLRKAMKQKLAALPHEKKCAFSADIVRRVTCLPEWRKAGTIGLTVSTSDEIDTTMMIVRAWKEKKRVAVPKTELINKTLDFRAINSFEQLETAYAGIREPILERTTSVLPQEIDMLVVPGLVFDLNGFRIGSGGGFYDRFLVDFAHVTIAFAFEMQIDKIPIESFDRAVDMIVTPERVLRTKAEE